MVSPMKVYVVHTEWERTTDGCRSVVEGVYASREAADAASAAAKLQYEEWGNTCYMPTGSPEGFEGNVDWDFDVHVEEHEVQGARP